MNIGSLWLGFVVPFRKEADDGFSVLLISACLLWCKNIEKPGNSVKNVSIDDRFVARPVTISSRLNKIRTRPTPLLIQSLLTANTGGRWRPTLETQGADDMG